MYCIVLYCIVLYCIVLYRYNKRHVALKLAYLGSAYHGFAIVEEDIGPTIEVQWNLSSETSSLSSETVIVQPPVHGNQLQLTYVSPYPPLYCYCTIAVKWRVGAGARDY